MVCPECLKKDLQMSVVANRYEIAIMRLEGLTEMMSEAIEDYYLRHGKLRCGTRTLREI